MIPHKIVFRQKTFTLVDGSAECQVDCWLDHRRSHSETFPSLSPLIVSKRSILYRHIPASVIFRSLQGLEKQAAEILLPEGCSHRLRFSADRCGRTTFSSHAAEKWDAWTAWNFALVPATLANGWQNAHSESKEFRCDSSEKRLSRAPKFVRWWGWISISSWRNAPGHPETSDRTSQHSTIYTRIPLSRVRFTYPSWYCEEVAMMW